MHLRRLAWFIPSLLAAWLEAVPREPLGRFSARDIQRILSDVEIVEGDEWAWAEGETSALASFCDAALQAAIATPLRRALPTEDWASGAFSVAAFEAALERQLHEQGRALETIELAVALRVPVEPIVTRWALDSRPDAFEHLLAGFRSSPARDAARLLAFRVVCDRLAAEFFHASGVRAAEIARAEALVYEQLAFRID